MVLSFKSYLLGKSLLSPILVNTLFLGCKVTVVEILVLEPSIGRFDYAAVFEGFA